MIEHHDRAKFEANPRSPKEENRINSIDAVGGDKTPCVIDSYTVTGKIPDQNLATMHMQMDVSTFDGQGKISKVESKQGAKIALEVTNAFQILLKVVEVAGVDLRM